MSTKRLNDSVAEQGTICQYAQRKPSLSCVDFTFRTEIVSYVISCAETDVNKYNKYNNNFFYRSKSIEQPSFASFNKFEMVGHIIRRVSLGSKRFDDDCELAYITFVYYIPEEFYGTL